MWLSVVLGAAGCVGRQSSARPLDLETVRGFDTANTKVVSVEERGGEIFVSVADRFGDAHLYKLTYDGVTRARALEILKSKQGALGTYK